MRIGVDSNMMAAHNNS